MPYSLAQVPTSSGSRYLQQLCKHWSHKLPVDFTPEVGTVTFPEAVVTMTAQAEALDVRVDGETEDILQQMKGVVANHLDRFAFREAPLAFDWKDGAA